MKKALSRQYDRSKRMQREILLQNMFYAAAAAHDLRLPPLYPVGGAANYGLLYLVLRLVGEGTATRILDIGAGQSTLLLDSLAKRFPIQVKTLESDSDWAKRIGTQVEHDVLYSPLDEVTIAGQRVQHYSDLSGLDGKFDLIVVDGPMGTDHFSRLGAIDLIGRFKAAEFVVIFDDAERQGERDTIEHFMQSQSSAQMGGCYFPLAMKQQFLAYSPRFAHVQYYGWL